MELINESNPIARKEYRCEECCELTSIIDFSDYYEGVDNYAFEEAITNYVQEYHQGAEDTIKVAFQNRNYYGLVKMILAELKEKKGIKHIKLVD